jgi:CheY-like chemotaxis protein
MPQQDPSLGGREADDSRASGGAPAVGRPREKPGVLVADDEYMVRIMVQLGLERNGFDVWLAPDGRAAIELYRQHRERIDVVLLEVCMPGLSGPQTLEALRELNPDVRACFMSGDEDAYDPEALRRHAAQLIPKPFRPDQLADTLRLVMQGVPAGKCPSGGGTPG